MPHNFINLNSKHDNFTKGVFLDSFDEPTYLTFALDFRFEDNIATSEVDELNLSNSPLFNTSTSTSAAGFLTNRGYAAQADGLATFKEILRHLTFNAPWYFQSIEGLSELYKANTDQSRGYKANPEKVKLDIKTLEAVDLRISELGALYRNAIFDAKHRRERVPDNLRWFSVDVYIAEFRNLRYKLPGESQGIARALGVNTGAIGNIVGGGNILSNVMDEYGYIKFSCRQCEFDFSESLPGGTKFDIGGEGRTPDNNKFSIKVGWMEEESKFADGTKLYDDPAKTNIRNPWGLRNIANTAQNVGNFLSGLPVIGDDIQKAGQKVQDGLSKVGGFINPALRAASEFLEPPVKSLGDVYSRGYSSNGDTVPPRQNPTDQNVYGG